MKKFLTRLLMFLLIFAMLLEPATALVSAAETKTALNINPEGEFFYQANPLYPRNATPRSAELPAREKVATTNQPICTSVSAVGKVLRNEMLARNTNYFYFWYRTPTSNPDWTQLYIDFYNAGFAHTGNPKEGDNLRWQFDGIGFGYTGNWYYEDGYYYIEFEYIYLYMTTLAQENQLDSAVKSLLSSLNLNGLTDYQKIYKIYDWMTKNIRYDYANLNNSGYRLQYTAYAALVNRTCVCQGYANLFYRLALEAGVDARIIAGGSGYGYRGPDYPKDYGAHSWNIVKMGNYYYNMDATWDESSSASPSTWNYFMVSDANFPLHYRDNGEYFQLSDGSVKGIDYTSTSFYNQYPMGKTNYDPNKDTFVAAPTISVTNVASSGKPKISWSKVSGASQYELYWASSQNGTYTKITTTSGTSVTNNSAKAGKQYYYKVKAVDANGNKSAFSNVVTRTCDLAQPVVSVTNVASTGKVKLSWAAVEGAAKYELYWAASKNGTYTKIATTSNTSIINNSAKAGKQYYYKVRAIHATNSGATSAYSEIVTRTCDLARPVVTATNVASTGKVKLSWNAVEGAAKYELYWASSKNGTYTKIATTTATSIINNSAKAGKQYYYKVRAIHATNSGATSAYSEIVTRSCDLPQPTLTVKLNSKGQPVLSWSKVEGAAKYEVYRSTSKNGTYTLIYYSATNTSVTNTKDVKAGVTYYYKVRAVHGTNSGAHSAYSAIQSITAK